MKFDLKNHINTSADFYRLFSITIPCLLQEYHFICDLPIPSFGDKRTEKFFASKVQESS